MFFRRPDKWGILGSTPGTKWTSWYEISAGCNLRISERSSSFVATNNTTVFNPISSKSVYCLVSTLEYGHCFLQFHTHVLARFSFSELCIQNMVSDTLSILPNMLLTNKFNFKELFFKHLLLATLKKHLLNSRNYQCFTWRGVL